MAYRLRFVVSTFSGLLTVALCVLWARSYNRESLVTIGISPGPGVMLGSVSGELSVARFWRIEGMVSRGVDAWEIRHEGRLAWEGVPSKEIWGVRAGSFFVAVPYPFAILLVAAITVATPFAGLRRFSLCMLIIATTLVAIFFGLVVGLLR